MSKSVPTCTTSPIRVRALIYGLVVGCGTSPSSSPPASGSGSITGTVLGRQIAIHDAISFVDTGYEPSSTYGGISMSSSAGMCQDMVDNVQRANSFGLNMALTDNDNPFTVPSAGGDYVIFVDTGGTRPAHAAAVSLAFLDAHCGQTATATAASGTVHLDPPDGDVFSGTFDVTLDSGDGITGSFHPGSCPVATMGSTKPYSCR